MTPAPQPLGSVSVRSEVSGAPYDWALAQLRAALRARGLLAEDGGALVVHVRGVVSAGDLDSYDVVPADNTLVVSGATPRGVVYALLDLAERVEAGEPLQDRPLRGRPVGRIRGMARFFNSVEEDRPWLHDEAMWCEYLTMLVRHRFSGVSLNFGLQYNYPYYNRLITDCYLYFAYPFLVDVPGFGVSVAGLSAAERDRNLAMLRFIAARCAERGLDFRLGLWTHGYDFDDVPDANYQINGITAENHAPYCQAALRQLIAAVPDMTGLTIRVHVEAGVPEGSYAFWETVFEGLRDPGRKLTLDIHAKGTDARMIDIALGTGLEVIVSPKFMAEHTGLPYHQAAVRQREMPSAEQVGAMFALSEGSRKFLRYGYGDLLAADRRFDVLVRVWPGTQRVLLAADPALAAAYGRAGVFCGAAGIEFFEPLSFKGRMGSGRLGARFNYVSEALRPRYDWSKYEPMYALFGRLAYEPEATPETWLRPMRAIAGAAAADCLEALAPVSRVLPLFTQAHGVSACNNTYWPEIYDNMSIVYPPTHYPYGYDSGGATRFGDVTTFDPQLFANPAEFVGALYEGRRVAKFGPLDVAAAMERFADASALACARISDRGAAVQRMLVDARIMAGLGRFFAARFRSACAFELYLLTGLRDAYNDCAAAYRLARDAWVGVIQAADGVYLDDLSYGPQPWLRGAWRDRLGAIDRDIEDLAFWYINDRGRRPDDPARAQSTLALLRQWPGLMSVAMPEQEAVFTPGEALTIRAGRLPSGGHSGWRLHYRRVNQSELWRSVMMAGGDDAYRADIPADYTQTVFPLQFYVSAEGGAVPVLAPGFAEDLCGVPYRVAMPRAGFRR